MKHERATKKHSYALYRKGWGLVDIAGETGVTERTLARWRDGEDWDVKLDPGGVVDARFNYLVNKERKTEADWKEMKRLADLRGKFDKQAAKVIRHDIRQGF